MIPPRVLEVVRAHHQRLLEIAPKHRQRLLDMSRDLRDEVAAHLATLPEDSYVAQSQRAILLQLETTIATYEDGLEGALVDLGKVASRLGRSALADELDAWEGEFRGTIRRTGRVELAADLLDPGLLEYYQSSVERYGLEQIAHFRGVMAEGVLRGRTIIEIADPMAAASGLTPYQAERIVRTESSLAYHRRQVADLEQMFPEEAGTWEKELVATFDSRTGDDSKYVDGQRRKLGEAFEDNAGRRYQYPPNRPNDRETMVMVPPTQ